MLKVITVPNKILSSSTRPVEKIDEKIKKLVNDMEKILASQKDPKGVGLAANQVGINLSLFIVKPSEKAKIKVFINPKILKVVSGLRSPYRQTSNDTGRVTKKRKRRPVKLEGCLSIPRIWGPVKRAKKIYLEYQDALGKSYKRWFSGFEATIIQHEIDHLNGIVFTNRSMEQSQPLYKEVGDELVKVDLS